MPTVYNVSAITNILSGTIQRNVLVRGEVELADGHPNAFYLINGSNKLRCFIPPGVMVPILEQGQVVVVNGKITLFSRFSQYQIKVDNIQDAPVNGNEFNVTEITDEISRLIAETPELQNIWIQGKVLAVFGAAVSNWDLCDMDGSPALQIKCVRPGPINVPVVVGNNVCVQGEISIFPPRSLYQVSVTEVGPTTESSTPRCQCDGCESCRPQGGNQSCPSLQDLEYELCANCYHESPDREDRVAQAVYRSFDALRVNGFSPDTECQIQFGTRNGIADVVLSDSRGSLAAIAECKGAGYIGDGIEQLKSYLCATDTRFGIFANRKDPEQWEFYENRRRNQIDPITLDQFEDGIVKGITLRKQLKDQIKILESDCNQSRATIGDLSNEIDQLRTTKIQLKTEIGHLEQQKRELYASRKQWKEKIQQFETFLADLKSDLLDSEPALLSDNSVDPQKIRREKKQGIMNKLKNLFSKENA